MILQLGIRDSRVIEGCFGAVHNAEVVDVNSEDLPNDNEELMELIVFSVRKHRHIKLYGVKASSIESNTLIYSDRE